MIGKDCISIVSWSFAKRHFMNSWRSVTIEPVFLLFMLAHGFYGIVSQSLYIDKGGWHFKKVKLTQYHVI